MTNDWNEDPWDIIDEVPVHDLAAHGQTRGPSRSLVLIVVSVFLALVLIAGGGSLWYLRQVNPVGDPTTAVNFTVAANDTLNNVSSRLEKEKIITSARVFRWYVGRKGGITFYPGYFLLKPHDHMGNIMAVLNTPPEQTFTNVTFPEGFTLEQMAARLAEKVPRLDAANFLQQSVSGVVTSAFAPSGSTNLEGLLFPDTYQISGDDSATRVLQRMAGLMERVGRQEGIPKSEAQLGYSPYEVLTVASMIEREAKVDADRPKIARVIYNRLKRKMLLQIDATLRYKQDAALSISDLQKLDFPYNTYLYKGLPPTPIAQPGRASIRAALNPSPNPSAGDPICVGLKSNEKCEYLYYVIADKEGGHVFAETFAQHEANIAKAKLAGVM